VGSQLNIEGGKEKGILLVTWAEKGIPESFNMDAHPRFLKKTPSLGLELGEGGLIP